MLQLAVGVSYALAMPLWQGHEQDFYQVLRFMVRNGRLPTEADYPAGDADIRQATHPPLYFLAASPLIALLDDDQPVPPGVQPSLICIGGEATNATAISYPLTPAYNFPGSGAVAAGYGLRVLNLLFGMIAAAFTCLAGRRLFARQPAIPLIGAALLAFEPNIVQMVTAISNDALLLALAAVNLYCAARMIERDRINWRWVVPLVGTGLLAMLTRLTGWAVFGFVLLVVGYAIARSLWEARRQASRRQLQLAIAALLILLVAVGVVAAFNYSQSGTIFGRYQALDAIVFGGLQNLNLPRETVFGVFDHTRREFVSPFTRLTDRRTLHVLYVLPVFAALAGAFIGLLLGVFGGARQRFSGKPSAYLLLFAGAGVATLLVLFRNMLNIEALGGVTLYNTAAIFAPIRYYNAGLPAVALLLSAGLMVFTQLVRRVPLPVLHRLTVINLLGVAMALLWLTVTGFGALSLMRERGTVSVVDQDTYQQAAGGALTLTQADDGTPIVYAAVITPRVEDGYVDLTLSAGLAEASTLNHAVQVEMSQAGQVLNRCEFLPERGYYPTTIWQSETVVTFDATLPNCAPISDSPIDLSLRWLGADMNGDIQSVSPPVNLGSLDTGLARAESCPEILATFTDSYHLTKFNSPSQVRLGETYIPSLNWIAIESSSDAAGRIFIFTHDETGEQYSCAAADMLVPTWERGEYVYFDRCSMTFPLNATPGAYRVGVYMVDAAGVRLPVVDDATNPLEDRVVDVGTIALLPRKKLR